MAELRMSWSVAPISQVLLVPLVQWFVHEHGLRMLLLAVALAALPALLVAWSLCSWRSAARPPLLRPGNQRLARGEALHLGHESGQLTVLQGRLWLTRDGECADYFVAAGDRIEVTAGDGVVVEPVGAGQGVRVHWWPQAQEGRSGNGQRHARWRLKLPPWLDRTTRVNC